MIKITNKLSALLSVTAETKTLDNFVYSDEARHILKWFWTLQFHIFLWRIVDPMDVSFSARWGIRIYFGNIYFQFTKKLNPISVLMEPLKHSNILFWKTFNTRWVF